MAPSKYFGVTQNPQYSKTAVLNKRSTQKSARSRNLRFFRRFLQLPENNTSILKDDMENLDNYLFQELKTKTKTKTIIF